MHFNAYIIDDLVTEWKEDAHSGIQISHHEFLNTMLFAEDQVVILVSKDKLQLAIHKLNQLCGSSYLKIFIQKTKARHFWEKIRYSKILIEN